MPAPVANEQLSKITTLWTLLRQAHGATNVDVSAAQRQLLDRYHGAVYRYLRGALGDEDAALELFQEFALRFLRGGFRKATPTRGRFRDYLKTALIHLVTDYHRQRQRRPRPLPADVAQPSNPSDDERDFNDSWREELIAHAWDALAVENPTYHAVLLLHSQNPDLVSSRAAEMLTAQTGKPHTAGNVRVLLHRARQRFAALLRAEVARSLESADAADVQAELRDLALSKLAAPGAAS